MRKQSYRAVEQEGSGKDSKRTQIRQQSNLGRKCTNKVVFENPKVFCGNNQSLVCVASKYHATPFRVCRTYEVVSVFRARMVDCRSIHSYIVLVRLQESIWKIRRRKWYHNVVHSCRLTQFGSKPDFRRYSARKRICLQIEKNYQIQG